MFILRIEGGPRAGQERPFTGTSLTIGRQADCDLVLPDGQLSRRHARLDLTPGGIVVSDLGSANGTRLNGRPLAAPTLVQSGDIIQIGDSAIRLVVTPGAPVAGVSASSPAPLVPPRRGRSRLPLVAGAILALLVLCVCAGGGVVALSGRDRTPTATTAPAVANAPVPTASGNSAPLAPTAIPGQRSARPAPSAAVGGRSFAGKVTGGYEITFKVSADGKAISEVHARVLERCNDKSYSQELTFLPPVTFPVATDGSFSGEGRYEDGGPIYNFAGQLNGDAATGTLKEEWAGGGTICTTYKLTWEATRQR